MRLSLALIKTVNPQLSRWHEKPLTLYALHNELARPTEEKLAASSKETGTFQNLRLVEPDEWTKLTGDTGDELVIHLGQEKRTNKPRR